MTFDPNISPTALVQQLRAQAEVKADVTPAAPAEVEPEEALEPDDPPAGEELTDAEDERELTLAQREKDLEERIRRADEREKNMERGFQKAMQKAAAERKQARESNKAAREVTFLAEKMGENPEFARDFMTLAQNYGIRLPDLTRDDIAEAMDEFKEELFDKMEQEKVEERAKAYSALLDAEGERLTALYKLKPGDFDKILEIAGDEDLPLLRPGMTPAQVRKALELALPKVILPRAAADGQRRLLSRGKGQKSAAALATAPAPPPTLRAKGFGESPEEVLRKLRGN